jgi:hypothetical protein
MFIDNAMNSIVGAPAERNVLAMVRAPTSGFAPLEREEIFSGRAFYKHLAPNGAKARMFCFASKLNSRRGKKLKIRK